MEATILVDVIKTVLEIITIPEIKQALTKGLPIENLVGMIKRESYEDPMDYEMICAFNEALEEACNILGWEYNSLALSHEFNAELHFLELAKSRESLIYLFGTLTGKQIDDKAVDIFINCFSNSIAKRPQLIKQIVFKEDSKKGEKAQIEYRKNYKNRIIAFVDILGFKNLVEDSSLDIYEFQKILDSLKKFRKLKKEKEDKYYIEDVKVTTFSDSLVISYPVEDGDKDVLYSVLLDLTRLQQELLEYNVIVRGGVTIGKLRHRIDENEIFGPAMNEAYYLESKVAKYPRIIICEDIIIHYCNIKRRNVSGSVDNKLIKLLRKDYGEDFYYLDYLGNTKLISSDEDYQHMLQKIKRIIRYGKQVSDEKTLPKYIWLEKYYISVMNRTNEPN